MQVHQDSLWGWALALAVSVVFAAVLFSATDRSYAELGDTNSVVAILQDGEVVGTGVAFGGNLIATAAHVVSDVYGGGAVGDFAFIRSDEDNRLRVGRVMFYDKVVDLAVIRLLDADGLVTSPLACEAPEIGQRVIVRGYPLYLGLVTSEGHYVRLDGPGRPPLTIFPPATVLWPHFYLIDAAATFGNSGGPVYDEYGRVTGLVVGLVRDPLRSITGLIVVLPGTEICKALDIPAFA